MPEVTFIRKNNLVVVAENMCITSGAIKITFSI